MRETTRRAWACALLSAALLAGWFVPPASAQEKRRKPVVISFGQPNIWSLEQAHYLLARMHMENLDLKAKALAQEGLDPNEINGIRINRLKSLLEIGVAFDDAVRFENALRKRNMSYNSERRLTLITRRDQLQSESLALTRELAALRVERARMDDDGSTEKEQALKDKEIEQKTAELAEVDKHITQINAEMDTLNAPSGDLEAVEPSATPFDKGRLPTSFLDNLFEKNAEEMIKSFGADPKLNASTVLDNHIQMQYEIIAKQLTLLRDEVGPGERLVFLEIPQSVYTSASRGDEMMAQSWWHVNGYTRMDDIVRLVVELQSLKDRFRQLLKLNNYFNIPMEKVRSYETRYSLSDARPARGGGAGRVNIASLAGLPPSPSQTPRPPRYGDPNFVGEPVNLNVVNADIRDILNYITEQFGVNFVLDDSVKAVPVTVNLSEVPWNFALDVILKSKRLVAQINSGGVLRILARGQAIKEAQSDGAQSVDDENPCAAHLKAQNVKQSAKDSAKEQTEQARELRKKAAELKKKAAEAKAQSREAGQPAPPQSPPQGRRRRRGRARDAQTAEAEAQAAGEQAYTPKPQAETLKQEAEALEEQAQMLEDAARELERWAGQQSAQDAFNEYACNYERSKEEILKNLLDEVRNRLERVKQGGARDTSEVANAIREIVQVVAQGDKAHDEVEVLSNYVIARDGTNNTGIASSETAEAILDYVLGLESPRLKDGIEFVRVDDREVDKVEETEADGKVIKWVASSAENQVVRTVDIIPRQSSLNVNDIQETVKATGLAGLFKFMFGLGVRANYQRQREQYEQFVHQELYASGFGKGGKDFGWTFGALPGTKRVAPGVRTTYAVMVVPEEAQSIVLTAAGCYFPRKGHQPLNFGDTGHTDWRIPDKYKRASCGGEQTFIIPIPGGGNVNNFWVTGLQYQPVEKGKRVTVTVHGRNFSTQTGVLVNGVSLNPTIGLAQPFLKARQGAAAAGANAVGEYERVDSQQVVISFTMPADFSGTPDITLIAPGKAVTLNSLRDLYINSTRNTSLDKADFMFGKRAGPPQEKLSLADFKVFLVGGAAKPPLAYATLSGTKFADGDKVFINGEELLANQPAGSPGKLRVSERLYKLVFKLPPDESLTVTVASGDGEPVTKTQPNPLALKISGITKLDYEPPGKNSKGVLTIRVEGAGFGPGTELQVEGASKLSKILDVGSGEAIVKLVEPESVIKVTLKNKGQSASAVVARDAPPDN